MIDAPRIDAPMRHLLAELVRRESRSLLQYFLDTTPWVTLEDQGVLEELRKLGSAERQATSRIAQWLMRHGGAIPPLGVYPAEFTNINFVSLEHLLGLLVTEQGRTLAALEADLARLTEATARARVQELLELKRNHLTRLQALAASHPAALATAR